MTVSACVVYHSGYGHTKKQAEAVHEGMAGVDDVDAHLIPVADLESEDADAWSIRPTPSSSAARPTWARRRPV